MLLTAHCMILQKKMSNNHTSNVVFFVGHGSPNENIPSVISSVPVPPSLAPNEVIFTSPEGQHCLFYNYHPHSGSSKSVTQKESDDEQPRRRELLHNYVGQYNTQLVLALVCCNNKGSMEDNSQTSQPQTVVRTPVIDSNGSVQTTPIDDVNTL